MAESGTTVVEVAPDGTQTPFVSGLGSLGPITFDSSGNLYVGTDSASGYGGDIYRYTPPAGSQTTLTGYPTIADPTGLAFDSNANLFESQYNTDSSNNSIINKISLDGTVTAFATVQNSQGGVAFDSHGTLFVASTGGNTVAAITPTGTVSTFATGLDEPRRPGDRLRRQRLCGRLRERSRTDGIQDHSGWSREYVRERIAGAIRSGRRPVR